MLVPREAPLSDIHLEHMLRLSRMGTVIFPPVPALPPSARHHRRPGLLHGDLRPLDQFDLHLDAAGRWDGRMQTSAANR